MNMAKLKSTGSRERELYDLLILVDSTTSMTSYLDSLRRTLPQVISISTLTGCFSRLGLLAYTDNAARELLIWSGWTTPSDSAQLLTSARKLYPMANYDTPEACKTGLARAYELMRPEARTIILLYADAPPHTLANDTGNSCYSNYGPEKDALSNKVSYSGNGPLFVDWVSAANALRGKEKKAQVFPILQMDMSFSDAGYYNYLSTITGGACFYLRDSQPASISKVTVEVLLGWMGVEKAGADASAEILAWWTEYTNTDNIENIIDERDPVGASFFLTGTKHQSIDGANITKICLTSEILKRYLPKKATPVQDFAKRYAVGDDEYKRIAITQLRSIIQEDVTAISLNPVSFSKPDHLNSY